MYEYFDVFMKLCTSFDGYILVSKMQRTCNTCRLGYDLNLGIVVLKNLCWKLIK
jgi:hypothetical protein